MHAILREADPAQRFSGEKTGGCLLTGSTLSGLPAFALWWAEYQQKMRDPRLGPPGCRVVPITGSPDQPISRDPFAS